MLLCLGCNHYRESDPYDGPCYSKNLTIISSRLSCKHIIRDCKCPCWNKKVIELTIANILK